MWLYPGLEAPGRGPGDPLLGQALTLHCEEVGAGIPGVSEEARVWI